MEIIKENESLGKSFYSLSFNFQKVANFTQSITQQSNNQSIYLFIITFQKIRILGCYNSLLRNEPSNLLSTTQRNPQWKHQCRCQNQTFLGRGSRTVRLGSKVTGGGGHDVYPGLGPLDGGNTLLPAWLTLMNIGVTRVDLPRDRHG